MDQLLHRRSSNTQSMEVSEHGIFSLAVCEVMFVAQSDRFHLLLLDGTATLILRQGCDTGDGSNASFLDFLHSVLLAFGRLRMGAGMRVRSSELSVGGDNAARPSVFVSQCLWLSRVSVCFLSSQCAELHSALCLSELDLALCSSKLDSALCSSELDSAVRLSELHSCHCSVSLLTPPSFLPSDAFLKSLCFYVASPSLLSSTSHQ